MYALTIRQALRHRAPVTSLSALRFQRLQTCPTTNVIAVRYNSGTTPPAASKDSSNVDVVVPIRRQFTGAGSRDHPKPKEAWYRIPKTAGWYEYYLTRDIRKTHRQGKPPSYFDSLKSDSRKLELPKSLQDQPLAIFDDRYAHLATVSMVQKCLEFYISTNMTKAAPTLSEARETYIRDRPGSRALGWSMSLQDSARLNCWDDGRFLGPTALCLVAENNMDVLWHWLRLDAHLGPSNPLGGTSPRWKQNLLQAIVESQIYWADGSDPFASAVTSVFTAHNAHMGIQRQAIMTLINAMQRSPKLNADLYDRFVSIVRDCFKRPEEVQWLLARLELSHPTSPNAAGMIQLFRATDSAAIVHWLSPKNHHAGLAVYSTLIQLAQQCAADKNKSDAMWVLDFAYARVPHLFSGPAAQKAFMDKARTVHELSPVPYQPSAREIRSRPLDGSGRLTSLTRSEYEQWQKSATLRYKLQ